MSHRISRLGRVSRKYRIRRRPARPALSAPPLQQDFAALIQGDLAVDLPDEDFAEDLSETLDMYVLGSKPRCEEAEYLELMEDAIERIARGR